MTKQRERVHAGWGLELVPPPCEQERLRLCTQALAMVLGHGADGREKHVVVDRRQNPRGGEWVDWALVAVDPASSPTMLEVLDRAAWRAEAPEAPTDDVEAAEAWLRLWLRDVGSTWAQPYLHHLLTECSLLCELALAPDANLGDGQDRWTPLLRQVGQHVLALLFKARENELSRFGEAPGEPAGCQHEGPARGQHEGAGPGEAP